MEFCCKMCYNRRMQNGKNTQRSKRPGMRFRQSLFWDVDPKTIDPKKHARYIIERILDFGTEREMRWMWLYYKHSLLLDVVERSRVIHDNPRRFWKLLLESEKELNPWQRLIRLPNVSHWLKKQ